MSKIININTYVSLAHKVNEESQVKTGRVKPGENIPHLKRIGAAQLHFVVVTCKIGAQCC